MILFNGKETSYEKKMTNRFSQLISLILVLTLLSPFVFTYASVNNLITENDIHINNMNRLLYEQI